MALSCATAVALRDVSRGRESNHVATYEYTMGKDIDLKAEQEKTLSAPVMAANAILRSMYFGMDVLYGRAPTLGKARVLEVLARYPYWAWERGGYRGITRLFRGQDRPPRQGVDRGLRHIDLGRRSQDNEQWHLMLICDLMKQEGIRQGWIRRAFLPMAMGLTYFFLTELIYRIVPTVSFSMNARFESHAEHEYMKLAGKDLAWETKKPETEYFAYYPEQPTIADLLRRIALDERDHMNESREEYERLTGRELA